MSKPVILTGLRANNDLHIGNYLGALLPLIDMAKSKAGEYQVNIFVPDLHSFTTPIDHGILQAGIMRNLKVFTAAGLPLDNPDVHIYRQSYVPAHSELTWILDCFTYMGEMNRMTQFKDKAATIGGEDATVAEYTTGSRSQAEIGKSLIEQQAKRSVSVGLFNYPVLMAADILLYGASYIPVGEDQTQHIEFSRNIAQRMNVRFSQELFIVPNEVKQQHEFFGKDQGLRIKDLADPTKKMSKSDETGKGVIFMTDSPDEARQKIMAATTDSLGKIAYDKELQPGIANLLDILALVSGRGLSEVRREYEGQTQYGPLKVAVADVLAEFLTKFQDDLVRVNDQAIVDKLAASEKLMNEQANATLYRVQKAVGLRA
jgi:tryptophanyl-tRNA synthetase